MLLPFDFAVLTSDEASILFEFIEKATETKACPKNYKKMQELGIHDIYVNLREFLEMRHSYCNNLRYLNPDDYQTKSGW